MVHLKKFATNFSSNWRYILCSWKTTFKIYQQQHSLQNQWFLTIYYYILKKKQEEEEKIFFKKKKDFPYSVKFNNVLWCRTTSSDLRMHVFFILFFPVISIVTDWVPEIRGVSGFGRPEDWEIFLRQIKAFFCLHCLPIFFSQSSTQKSEFGYPTRH